MARARARARAESLEKHTHLGISNNGVDTCVMNQWLAI